MSKTGYGYQSEFVSVNAEIHCNLIATSFLFSRTETSQIRDSQWRGRWATYMDDFLFVQPLMSFLNVSGIHELEAMNRGVGGFPGVITPRNALSKKCIRNVDSNRLPCKRLGKIAIEHQ